MVTNIPRAKVKTKMVFCREGRRIPVRTGIGNARIARSVTMLTGAAHINSVRSGMHVDLPRKSAVQAARIGSHWKMFIKVRTRPATLTVTKVTHEA